MSNNRQEGKKPQNQGGKRIKKLQKQKIMRLALILAAIFLLISSIAGFATYKVVSAYWAELPELDPWKLVPSATSFIYDKDGVEVTPLLGAENRILIPLEEISPYVVDAFIAIEDERFFEHSGFDLRGIFRAFYNNLTNQSGSTQGGSTITQQLVKNAFLTPERTIKRKVQELYLAYQLERIFTKEEILEFYLNHIFFDFNAYGVEAAAQTYFGKSARDVTLAEAAMLAGIPNRPARFSPFRNMAEAKNRQTIILARMADLGMVTREQAAQARKEEIVLASRPERTYPYPFFIDHVILEEAPAVIGALADFKHLSRAEIFNMLYKGGLHIYTTLDRELQQKVENILDDPKNYPNSTQEENKPIQPQAAVVVAQPHTGFISAMVGGREYKSEVNVFNRAVKGRMQAGSVLKPIVAYAPAFHEGIASTGTVVDDAPSIFQPQGGPLYFPNNYDRNFRGLVTLRYALAHSLNIPAVRLLDELGIEKGKEYARKMGITSFSEQDAGHSIVVGGLHSGVSVWETAQAFSVLANEGIRTDFATITKIVDRSGKVIYQHKPSAEEVISPEAAWLTTSALQDAVRFGTASGLRIGRPVAAKTGTSDKARDAWMAAYTPDYVAVFWIGRDSWPDDRDGNFRAFQITPRFMNAIMNAAHAGLPARDFQRPDSLRSVAVCSQSGLLPGPHCTPVTDWFQSRSVPATTCNLHIQVEICKESGLLASDFCPSDFRVQRVFFNRPPFILTDERWPGRVGRGPADTGQSPPTETCAMHTSRPGKAEGLEVWFRDDVVSLSWKAGSGASAYLVYRKGPGEDSFKRLTPSAITALNFTETQLAAGNHTYRVVAVNSQGVAAEPASISVTVTASYSPLPQDSPRQNDSNGSSSNNDDGNDSRNGNGNTNRGNRGLR